MFPSTFPDPFCSICPKGAGSTDGRDVPRYPDARACGPRSDGGHRCYDWPRCRDSH
jgi:hypothetical protein